MKTLLFGLALIAIASIESYAVPLGVTVGISPSSHPISSLYHSQDILGQYSYGYATPTSTKAETKTADGVTRGGYSYIDSDGILQTVQYISDPVHGFRVAATNLPRDLPEVALAKAQHLASYASIGAQHAAARTNAVVVPALPQPVQDLPEVVAARAAHLATLQAAYAGVAIQPVQDLPEVARARAEHLAIVEETKARNAAIQLSPVQLTGNVVAVHTQPTPVAAPAQISYTPVLINGGSAQYHAQDGLGQYSYGYVEPLSSKSETRSADGVTRGGYSYIDANGIIQTVAYVADAVNGFRVAATNLPVGPRAPVPVVAKRSHIVAPAALYSQEVVY